MTMMVRVCLLLQTRGAAVASEVEVAAAASGVEAAVDTIAVVATTVATSARAAQCERTVAIAVSSKWEIYRAQDGVTCK